ncbi:MAG: GntR family transcriptional regulator [Clostridia bacterium]|nr:GntR family transcriptional regulator [Clostridia bacterium]
MKKTAGVSLYHQIKSDLAKKIATMPNGAKIPTETELMGVYGVCRGTVRQAVADLVSEGRLYKIQGSGTYKGTARPQESYLVANTFTEQIRASGKEPGIDMISLETVKVCEHLAEVLEVADGTEVWCLSRRRLVDFEPCVYSRAYIRKEVLPELSENDLEMSLVAMFRDRFNKPVKECSITCRAASATREIGKIIDVPTKSPILYMENISKGDDQKPMFVDVSYFTDSYLLRFEPDTMN